MTHTISVKWLIIEYRLNHQLIPHGGWASSYTLYLICITLFWYIRLLFFPILSVYIEIQNNASGRDNIVLMIYLVVAISYDFLPTKMQQNTFPQYKSQNWGEYMSCGLDIEWFAKYYGDISPRYLSNRLYSHVCLFRKYPWHWWQVHIRWQLSTIPSSNHILKTSQPIASGWTFYNLVIVDHWLLFGSTTAHTTQSTCILATSWMLMRVLHASCKSLPAWCVSCFAASFICTFCIITMVCRLSAIHHQIIYTSCDTVSPAIVWGPESRSHTGSWTQLCAKDVPCTAQTNSEKQKEISTPGTWDTD